MARRCELTGTRPLSGNNVSHAQNKTLRRFLPNLSQVTLASDLLGDSIKLKVSVKALRSVEHLGGIDAFLAKASDASLSRKARRYKRRILEEMSARG